MFIPTTKKLEELTLQNRRTISALEVMLHGNVMVYIDYANVRPWSEKLKWHIDLRRLKQFLDSFSTIQEVKFYCGTLKGDEKSEKEKELIKSTGYILRTKPVKIMTLSIEVKGIVSLYSSSLLEQFIRRCLLRKYALETVKYLNKCFLDMNTRGIYSLEDRKCNFDVEIGVDMLLDAERKPMDTCILWSGDSDFHDPIQKLLHDGKRVVLFATVRRVSRELNNLQKQGLIIFDIQKIRKFICWNRELQIMQKSPSVEGL